MTKNITRSFRISLAGFGIMFLSIFTLGIFGNLPLSNMINQIASIPLFIGAGVTVFSTISMIILCTLEAIDRYK